MYYNHLDHPFPCLHCQPHTYIRMVHNLIERCLLLHMDRDECVKALAEHARIRPLVTLTVWKELMKENKDFFKSYFQSLSPRPYSNLFDLGLRDLQEEISGGNKQKKMKQFWDIWARRRYT